MKKNPRCSNKIAEKFDWFSFSQTIGYKKIIIIKGSFLISSILN